MRQKVKREWYSVGEFCELVGLHAHSAYRLIRRGRIKASRPGRKLIRIHREEIARFMKVKPYRPVPSTDNISIWRAKQQAQAESQAQSQPQAEDQAK